MNIYLYNITKEKTNILGYWKHENKVYIDNISIIKHNKKSFKKAKKDLFLQGEKAIFYKIGKKGYIEYPNGKIDILNNRREYKYKKSYNNIQSIKDIIKKFGGCTVYNTKGFIVIEVFAK